MINNKKQVSGDNSSNYMAEGNITINNGFSKEDVLELFKKLSEKTQIDCEELVTTRETIKKSLMPLFVENKEIFDTYGPMTEERFNPESEMPEIWLRKIKEFILPNNDKIISTIEENIHLLLDWELDVFTKYRQHVDDFNAKHTGKTKANGTIFPKEILNILE